MLYHKVLSLFVLCLLALVNGMPQTDNNQDPASVPPLIQFTNGGLRFNFGGYHAEAGLGGLLGGGKTGGGLHASAGTPWGAHAAAGLGGLLSGDNANAGGNIYARAGLGEGRHAAAAGLGGFLDGSGRSGALSSGEIYAGATTGTHGVGVSTSGAKVATPPSGATGPTTSGDGNDGGKSGKGRTNIQVIARSEKNAGKTVSNNAEASTEVQKQKEHSSNKEVREVNAVKQEPGKSVSVFGSASVNPLKTVEVLEAAPPAPPLVNEANEVVVLDYGPRVKHAHPKWFLRKRFWGPRKQFILNSSAESQEASDINTQRISRRQIPPSVNNAPPSHAIMQVPNDNNGFYDNVFQIPISTLNAVNQLLNTNSG
ncbi:hypothetical protein ANTRET_LOCUS3844 [Anthophora retusa]